MGFIVFSMYILVWFIDGFLLNDYHCTTIGNAFKDAGKVEDAIACYSTAISLEPNYAEAYANLAAVHKVSR